MSNPSSFHIYKDPGVYSKSTMDYNLAKFEQLSHFLQRMKVVHFSVLERAVTLYKTLILESSMSSRDMVIMLGSLQGRIS